MLETLTFNTTRAGMGNRHKILEVRVLSVNGPARGREAFIRGIPVLVTLKREPLHKEIRLSQDKPSSSKCRHNHMSDMNKS